MRPALFFSALLLTGMAATSAHAQSMMDNVRRFTPHQRSIYEQGLNRYGLWIYGRDGTRFTGQEINRSGMLGLLLAVEGSCNAQAVERVRTGRLTTPAAVGEFRLRCTQAAYVREHLPYTVSFSRQGYDK